MFGSSRKTYRPDRYQSYEQAKQYVQRHWKYVEPSSSVATDSLLERARSHYLCISGMAFQDAWNVDLKRLHRCCIHVLTPDGKPVPFCVHYMTRHPRPGVVEVLHCISNSGSTQS